MGVLDGYRYIINDQGDVVPCPDLMEWAKWFEPRCATVARTVLDNGLEVSTIFLGLDHSFGFVELGFGPDPELFETIVFLGRNVFDGPWRYPDWDKAAAAHLTLVEEYKKRAAGD